MDEPPSSVTESTVASIRSTARGRQRLITLSDGQEFLFSEEACERAGVTEGAVADPGLLQSLEAEEQRVVAHAAALRLLSHRSRSEKEMRTRLAMRGIAPELIDAEVERLRASGLLDDEKFARAWVEDRRQHSPRGRQMLRFELLGRGIDPEDVDDVTAEVDDRETAAELARRKARAAKPDLSYEVFYARIGGFLRRRGFDYEVVAEATRSAWRELQEGTMEADGEAVV